MVREHVEVVFGSIQRERKFTWCANQRPLAFDFCMSERVILELDGGTHFRDVSGWRSFADVVRQKDTYKAYRLVQNATSVGITGFIRIHQEDVYFGRFDWKSALTTAIRACLAATELEFHYLSVDPCVYDKHRDDLAAALASDVPPMYMEDKEVEEGVEEMVGKKRKRSDEMQEEPKLSKRART